MALRITCSPASFDFGHIRAGTTSQPQEFRIDFGDSMNSSPTPTPVQIQVTTSASGPSSFLLTPTAGWTPSSGQVTLATTPSSYGPTTKKGHVSISVVCTAELPVGAEPGSLIAKIMPSGPEVRVPLSVTVDAAMAALQVEAAGAVA